MRVAWCFFFCLLVPVAAIADSALEADLQGLLENFLAANPNAPGVSAVVICPSLGLEWSGAVGTVDHGSDQPLTPAHTFRIASNTKTYVAAAVLRLVETGRLGLDDSLGEHLRADQRALLESDGYDLDTITIRMVMSHTGGLDEHAGDPRYEEAILENPQRVWTAEETVRLLVEWRDPVGAPGEKYVYSDTGYIMLGGVIERLTGKPLGEAVHDLLDYEGLGLEATWWEITEQPPAGAGPRAHQYYGELDTMDWHPSLDLFGGGGLITDTPDLAYFMRQLLQGEVLYEWDTLAAMNGYGTPDYRLGLMCVELDGHLAFGHQGFWNTFAFHVPILDLTVAGCILNHHATNGRELAAELVTSVAARTE